jgi:geranylgeranyl diphosphate synthase type I/geranylgeranyl diphosphate synthase type II
LNLAFEIVWHDRNLLGPETAGHIIEEIAWEHFVTGLGTVLDVTWPWNRRTDHLPEEYLQQVVHRTGSYSYRMPLKIGGLAAAVPESEVARLASFGEQLGLAFQIIDDVLNVRPGDEYWGKEVAEDVAQGKINLQVILALRAAEPEERRRLEEILNSRSHDPTMLAEAVRVIETSGALEESRNIARRLRDEAVSIVDTLQMDEVHRHRLKALAEYVLRRTR